MLHAVVMAGGSGKRFWPLSRARRPKQLLSLVTERTLLEETVARLEGLVPPERTWIVTNAAYAEETRRLLPDLPREHVLEEPCGRDTAPCIGFASGVVRRRDPDAVLAVLPADHVIRPAPELRRALGACESIVAAEPRTTCTIGVPPTRPATGYGYIERGPKVGEREGLPWYRVLGFREKPDLETARRFVAEGRFFWNAGIFVFSAGAMLEKIETYAPDLGRLLPHVLEEYGRSGRIARETYERLPKISIDYAVMEKDESIAVVEAPFQWDDVGSFAALERVLDPGEDGNRGLGDRVALDAAGNVVISGRGHLVALLGVKDLVVVHTADATLVCRKEEAERVKKLVERLEEDGRSDVL